jgi:hypothetical protein
MNQSVRADFPPQKPYDASVVTALLQRASSEHGSFRAACARVEIDTLCARRAPRFGQIDGHECVRFELVHPLCERLEEVGSAECLRCVVVDAPFLFHGLFSQCLSTPSSCPASCCFNGAPDVAAKSRIRAALGTRRGETRPTRRHALNVFRFSSFYAVKGASRNAGGERCWSDGAVELERPRPWQRSEERLWRDDEARAFRRASSAPPGQHRCNAVSPESRRVLQAPERPGATRRLRPPCVLPA